MGRALLDCVDDLSARLDEVERIAPERIVRERDRLRKSVAALLNGSQLDEQRVAQEIARPRSHREVKTGRPVRASNVTGPMNSVADSVRTTSTVAPA